MIDRTERKQQRLFKLVSKDPRHSIVVVVVVVKISQHVTTCPAVQQHP